MREQLDGVDVGVGIGDAARHHRAGVSLLLADMAQARHKVAQRADVQRQPDDERRDQAQIKRAGQHHHGGYIHGHCHQHISHHKQRVAHGERGLHDLGGQPPGELVLVERHALAQHQAVKVPAQPHREVDRQRLVFHRGLQPHNAHAAHHQRAQHPQRRAVFGEKPGGRGGQFRLAQPVNDAAQKSKQQRLKSRQQPGQHRHHADVAACAVRTRP